MEEEDSRCKAPLLKRKQTSETCGSKAKKTADREEKEVQTESSGEETESSEEEEEMEDCVTDCQPLTDSPLASASQLDGMYSKAVSPEVHLCKPAMFFTLLNWHLIENRALYSTTAWGPGRQRGERE
ncbi:unnamed protein product [Arctogadus glacialis]